MPTFNTAHLNLNTPLYPSQIKYFRGSIIELVMSMKPVFDVMQIPTDLFHNHNEESDNPMDTLTRFPLIQYHIHNRKASITGIGKGADALNVLVMNKREELNIPSEVMPFQHKHVMELQKTPVLYRMYGWLGLNEDKYELYQKTAKLIDKVPILEQSLTNSILRFAETQNWDKHKKIETFIHDIGNSEYKRFKNFSLKSFDLTFGCNISLPENICLGKGCSMGYGKIQLLPNKKNQILKNKYSVPGENTIVLS